MTYSFTCPECKQQFITRDRRQKFCSHQCAGQIRKFPKQVKYTLPSQNPCFYHWRIPLEEIQRLMEEKHIEEKHIGI